MKTTARNFAVALGLVGYAFGSTALADICTSGAKNFHTKVTWSGGGTEEKSTCMFSCNTKDVKITHSDCYKSESSGSTFRYTCTITASGKDRKPKNGEWYGFEEKYKKTELPKNKTPDEVTSGAQLSCRD